MRRGLSYGFALFLWGAAVFELLRLGLLAVQGNLREARFLGHLLSQPETADRAAPLVVVVLFTWIVVLVFFRAVQIYREQKAVAELDTWSPAALDKIAESLRTGRRARLVLQHAGSPGKLSEALPAASALDAASLDNSYSVVKALVWTLPVLGFIGTAWGMAHAIRGFSEALGAASAVSNNGQLELLTQRLGQFVIPGLANAFSITMLALGVSVLAHFWVTTLQTWDQEVLEDLDRASVEKLAELTPAHTAGGLPPGLVAALIRGLEVMTGELRQLNGRLNHIDMGNELKAAAAAHVSAAQAVRAAAGELTTSVQAPYHITITRKPVE